jgi:hypothetical protein
MVKYQAEIGLNISDKYYMVYTLAKSVEDRLTENRSAQNSFAIGYYRWRIRFFVSTKSTAFSR